ncbi:MAG TPA: hypothetical protein VH583_23310 [Vicinamibacterales bacterium]|jgi:hypothetical protein
MGVSNRFALYEQKANILQAIAQRYAADSIEHQVLKEAAFALCFALTEKSAEFATYLENTTSSLSDDEKSRLKSLGFDK